MQARDWSKGWFYNQVGNGEDTYLWYDYWMPMGNRPIDLFSQRTLSSTGLPWNARVAEVISGGQWHFPEGAENLHQLWDAINNQPQVMESDTVSWNHTSSGLFTISSAWDLLCDKWPKHRLYHILWHPLHVPRQTFILWLAGQNRLRIMDQTPQSSMIDNICELCHLHPESHDHLFFKCSFSSQVWNSTLQRAHLRWPTLGWTDFLQWASTQFHNKKEISHLIGPLVIASTVYHVWKERNRRVFHERGQPPGAIVEEIYQQIRSQLLGAFQSHAAPAGLQTTWNLQ